MDSETLKNFLVVAREGNITRAAQFIHITQPTLSRQMQNLEQELGDRRGDSQSFPIFCPAGAEFFRYLRGEDKGQPDGCSAGSWQLSHRAVGYQQRPTAGCH